MELLTHNAFGWFHALGAGALTWLFMVLYVYKRWFINYDYKRASFFSMMTVALIWEIGERFFTTFGHSQRFLGDSLADLIMAVVAGTIAVLCASIGEKWRR